MLQQTQVSRVTEYYPRFLERFGSIEALARARPSAVREAWDGLGYYARARNLHRLAKQVSGDGHRVPDDPAELVKLPGVGRYTAGAVACFAYEKPVAAVDTNVARVIRRMFIGERGAGRGRVRFGKEARRGRASTAPRSPLPVIWQVAESIVPQDGKLAWQFNQALMELGATVCVARKPKCTHCPVMRDCKTGRE
jgi:A/G-specific adenine glycosylase